jgi:hypothetical protein
VNELDRPIKRRPRIIMVKLLGNNLLNKLDGPSRKVPIAYTTKAMVITTVEFQMLIALLTIRQVIKKPAI